MNIEIVKFEPQSDGTVSVHLSGGSDLALQGPDARRAVFARAKEAGYPAHGLNRYVQGPKVDGKSTGQWIIVSSQWPAKSVRVGPWSRPRTS